MKPKQALVRQALGRKSDYHYFCIHAEYEFLFSETV